MDAAPTTPPAVAPVARSQPSRLGRIGLILVVLAIVAPIIGLIYVSLAGAWPGESPSSELGGYTWLSAIFFGLLVGMFAAPIAIAGVVLGIVSLTRRGVSKLAGILAIVLGIIPSLGIFNFIWWGLSGSPG